MLATSKCERRHVTHVTESEGNGGVYDVGRRRAGATGRSGGQVPAGLH